MMEWYEEFRAYARAFGNDEVAAILLRDENGDESIIWPAQTVEGLTFTLSAAAILDSVAPDDLQRVAGWIHSHPMGLDPNPSGTDDEQLRGAARDFAGNPVDMIIFGGHDYTVVSVTRAVYIDETVFVSDTSTRRLRGPATPYDDAAAAFYSASKAAPSVAPGPFPFRSSLRTSGVYSCVLCTSGRSDHAGGLCVQCDDEWYDDSRGESWLRSGESSYLPPWDDDGIV